MRSHRVITAHEVFSADRLVQRESSFRSAQYGVLRMGETLRLPVGKGERLAGVMINTGGYGGKVRIAGHESSGTNSDGRLVGGNAA